MFLEPDDPTNDSLYYNGGSVQTFHGIPGRKDVLLFDYEHLTKITVRAGEQIEAKSWVRHGELIVGPRMHPVRKRAELVQCMRREAARFRGELDRLRPDHERVAAELGERAVDRVR